jgi:hypothetical protein
MTYRGKVKGGAIVLEPGVELPEGVEVSVRVAAATSSDAVDPLFGMSDLAVDTGISDLATNVDHYLYGHPRVADDD